jgi:two-component system, cell cycle sensor histidine kinase and response regulator CckA
LGSELHVVIEAIPEPVVLVDDTGCIAHVNALALELFGATRDTLVGQPLSILVPSRFAKAHAEHEKSYNRAPDTRLMSKRGRLHARRLDGSEFPCEIGLSPVEHDGRRHVIALVRDVSDRERALQARDQSEARLRNVVTSAPVVLFTFDGRGDVTFCEGQALASLRLRAADVIGRPAAQLLGGTREAFGAVERALSGEEIFWTGAIGRTAFEARLVPHRNGTGEPGATGVLLDVTQRASAERALRQSEERYRWLFESSPLAIIVWDVETFEVLAVNQEAVRRYGYTREEFCNMTLLDLHPGPDLERDRQTVLEIAHTHGECTGAWHHKKKDGRVIEVETISLPVVYAGRRARQAAVRDVTEERLREGALRQSQKMEAVGRLAGGVAHDFNNMLSVVLSYAGMLLHSQALDEATRDDLHEVQHAAERAAALTRQLLAFSRQEVREPKVIDLNQAVGNMQKMLSRLIVERVTLETQLHADACHVFADASQMEQLILNLAVNARDAMPDGGRLLIETDRIELSGNEVPPFGGLEPGRYVRLSVSDTGVGMDEATMARVFEPFFSTKGPTRGTGLGLATVYGVVQQSGGAIRVRSELGAGSTFEVAFPEVSAPQREPRTPTQRPAVPGQGRILLVEDEPAVRRAARAILKRLGYDVLEARDAAEALALAKDRAEPLDLLLTDLVMPGMSGHELAKALSKLRPGLTVLFMSGYAANEALRNDVLDARVAFLQKPFTADTLAARVRAVLDRARSGDA